MMTAAKFFRVSLSLLLVSSLSLCFPHENEDSNIRYPREHQLHNLEDHGHGHGNNFKAKQSKIIKIKENQRTKEVVIKENTNIEDSGESKEAKEPKKILNELPLRKSPPQELEAPIKAPVSAGVQPCVVPHPFPIADVDGELYELLGHRTYLLMGNTRAINGISKRLRGKRWEEGDNSNACFRLLYAKYDVRIYGYDRIFKPDRCDVDNVLDLQCSYTSVSTGQTRELRQTAVWYEIDKNTGSALLISCANNEFGGWKLVSTKRSLEPELKERILNIISSKYGFDPTDYYEVPFENCPRYVKEESYEGVCDPNMRGISDTVKRSQIMDMLDDGVYTPMISRLNIYAQSRFLRGIDLLKDEELNHICRKDTWDVNSLTMNGFSNYTGVLYCNTADIGWVKCRPNDKDSSNDHIFIYNMKMSAVWTDGQKYALFVNCLSNNLRTWVLYSTERTVDEETRKFVIDRIEMYGFSRAKVHIIPYHECTNV